MASATYRCLVSHLWPVVEYIDTVDTDWLISVEHSIDGAGLDGWKSQTDNSGCLLRRRQGSRLFFCLFTLFLTATHHMWTPAPWPGIEPASAILQAGSLSYRTDCQGTVFIEHLTVPHHTQTTARSRADQFTCPLAFQWVYTKGNWGFDENRAGAWIKNVGRRHGLLRHFLHSPEFF